MQILVGEITKPQGIKGEVKVKPLTDTPFVFEDFSHVFIDGIKTKILNLRITGNDIYLYLEKVLTRESAEALRGKQLFVDKEELNLEDGQFLIEDCIGCEVFLQDEGEKIGTLIEIFQTYSIQTYVVENGKKTIMFPAIPDIFECFDIENKKIILNKKRFSEVSVHED